MSIQRVNEVRGMHLERLKALQSESSKEKIEGFEWTTLGLTGKP